MTERDEDFEPEHEHLLDDGTLPEGDDWLDDGEDEVDPLFDEEE
jgi:hypothetical protein